MSFDEVNFDDICNIEIQKKKDDDKSYITDLTYKKTNHFQNWLNNYVHNSEKIFLPSISQFGMGKTIPSLSVNYMFTKFSKIISPELSDPDTQKLKESFDDLEKQYVKLNYNEPSDALLHDEGWKKICDELKWDFTKK